MEHLNLNLSSNFQYKKYKNIKIIKNLNIVFKVHIYYLLTS